MALDNTYFTGITSNTNSITANKGQTKGKSELEMNDFIMLMVEQVKQQDMYNTTDTSQYVSQLSQYTMVEALTSIQEQLKSGMDSIREMSLSAYSMSMLGKEATVALQGADENSELTTITGIIEGVSYYNGEPMVVIDGEQYKLNQVMSVAEKDSEAAHKLAMESAEAAKRAAEAAEALVQMKVDEISVSNVPDDVLVTDEENSASEMDVVVEASNNEDNSETTETDNADNIEENQEPTQPTEIPVNENPTPFGDIIQ